MRYKVFNYLVFFTNFMSFLAEISPNKKWFGSNITQRRYIRTSKLIHNSFIIFESFSSFTIRLNLLEELKRFNRILLVLEKVRGFKHHLKEMHCFVTKG